MKVFIYRKRDNSLYVVLTNVREIEDKSQKINFLLEDNSILEVDKKIYKSTAYQN